MHKQVVRERDAGHKGVKLVTWQVTRALFTGFQAL